MLKEVAWTLNKGDFLIKMKDKPPKIDEPKQSSNAYLQLDVGHTWGLVSSPLFFLD